MKSLGDLDETGLKLEMFLILLLPILSEVVGQRWARERMADRNSKSILIIRNYILAEVFC